MTQKIPERLEIIDVMPRNPSGKVPKHELRAQDHPAARLDQRVEQALLRGVVGRGVLGVPLHGEQPTAPSSSSAFDDAVVGAADDAQAVAELVDRLVVVARATVDVVAPMTFGEQRVARRA